MTDIKKMEFSDETGEVNIERSNGTTVKYNMADVVTASTTSSGKVVGIQPPAVLTYLAEQICGVIGFGMAVAT